jgi:hypothetical protein
MDCSIATVSISGTLETRLRALAEAGFGGVERRGYDAYGAANATIRLAAQARFKEPPAD